MGRWRYLLACASAVAVGILLAAVQLLPMLELAAQSLRASMDFDIFAQFSLPPAQLPMLLFPFLFGSVGPRPYWGAWNITELSGYVGIAPVMLAAASLSLVRRNWRAAFWVAVAAVGLLLALGPATPLARLMFHVPGYNLLRAQARNLFELDFALAILAALALTAASRRALVAGAALVGALVVVVAAVALTVGESLWLPQAIATQGESMARELISRMSLANSAIWLPLLATGAAVAALSGVARRPSLPRCALLLAVQLGDLWYYGSVLGRAYPDRQWVLAPPPVVEAVGGLPLDVSATRVAVLTNSNEALDLRSTLWEVPLVNGYDPMLIARYAQFSLGMPYWGAIPPAAAFARPLFLDLLNARWVVVLHPPSVPAEGEIEAALADAGRWRLQRRTASYTVLENRLARPRAWLAGRTAVLSVAEVLHTIHDGRLPDGEVFDPSRIALIEEGAAVDYGLGATRGSVEIVSYAPGRIEMVTRSDGPALLVVSEIAYPGWQAFMDDREVPIVRADYVLRGLEVGPGEHRVQMVFAPRSLRIGVGVSALTAAALLLAMIVAGRGAHRGVPPPDAQGERGAAG